MVELPLNTIFHVLPPGVRMHVRVLPQPLPQFCLPLLFLLLPLSWACTDIQGDANHFDFCWGNYDILFFFCKWQRKGVNLDLLTSNHWAL